MAEVSATAEPLARTDSTGVRRVLLVLQSVAVGGMEAHCRYHAAELARRGVETTVVVPEGSGFDDLARVIADEGSRVRRLSTDARQGRLAQVWRGLRLWAMIVSARPSTVHLHTGGATGGLLVVGAARLGGAAAVVSEHDVPAVEPRAWDRASRRLMDRFTNTLVAVSRRNASLRMERLGRQARMASVLNGVPIPRVDEREAARNRRDVRSALGIDAGAVVFGSVVRLAEGKGLDDLLRAFACVAGTWPEAVLVLVGEGPLRQSLEALAARLGIAERVRFAGQQAQPGRHMDAMDVFVLAVPAGSMSIALLEAMARGVAPVITFCGPEEAVVPERTGLCAPPNDPEGLAAVLCRLVGDERLRRRLGAVAARHVARCFSVSRVADDLLEIYGSARHTVPVRLRP